MIALHQAVSSASLVFTLQATTPTNSCWSMALAYQRRMFNRFAPVIAEFQKLIAQQRRRKSAIKLRSQGTKLVLRSAYHCHAFVKPRFGIKSLIQPSQLMFQKGRKNKSEDRQKGINVSLLDQTFALNVGIHITLMVCLAFLSHVDANMG
jgi:hypothetical protein